MTAEDVFNDENDRAMVVRFRGGVGGWSDKVLGCAQPAPGAVALLGVAGMFGGRRRR
jgi:MYXO-CTERM domain-containing protein